MPRVPLLWLCSQSGDPEEHTRCSGLVWQLLQGHLFLTPWCEMLLLSLKHLFSQCEALLISEEDILPKKKQNNQP